MKEQSLASRVMTIKRQRLFVYLILVIPAVLQFAIFYVYANVNSVVMSFQDYDFEAGRYYWVGLDNYKQVLSDIANDTTLVWTIKNSMILWISTFLFFPFSVFVAFYIYKKMPLSGFFLTVLMLPSMVASLIFSLIFKYFADQGIPALWELLTGQEIFGLLANPDTVRWTLLINSMWGGLSSNLVMNYNAMKRINDSTVEAATLDGCTIAKEFFYITIPGVFSTLTIWLTGMVAGLFSIEMGQLSIFGTDASSDLYTFGYYMYRKLKVGSYSTYSYLSALGMCMTAVALPLTLIVRKLLEKYGPSEN